MGGSPSDEKEVNVSVMSQGNESCRPTPWLLGSVYDEAYSDHLPLSLPLTAASANDGESLQGRVRRSLGR